MIGMSIACILSGLALWAIALCFEGSDKGWGHRAASIAFTLGLALNGVGMIGVTIGMVMT